MESSTTTPVFIKPISTEEYNKQKDDYTQQALKQLKEQMKTFEKPKSKVQEPEKTNMLLNKYKSTETKINKDEIINVDSESDYELEKDMNLENDNENENVFEDGDGDGDEKHKKKIKSSINLIIQHVTDSKKNNIIRPVPLRNSKPITNNLKTVHNSSNIHDAIYAQHELDINTINNFKLKIKENSAEIKEMENTLHYLKLDLCNFQCDNSDLKKQNEFLIKENTQLKKDVSIFEKNIKDRQFYIKIFKVAVILLLLLNVWIENFEFFLLLIGIVVCYF